jgi:hypothetical protein
MNYGKEHIRSGKQTLGIVRQYLGSLRQKLSFQNKEERLLQDTTD